jgi:hypothetical protein
MEKRRTFEELSEVSLTHAVEAEGFVMPSGATGVVMAAYADGLAYEVEFESPRHVVLTLEAADIRPAKEFMRDRSAGGRRSSG